MKVSRNTTPLVVDLEELYRILDHRNSHRDTHGGDHSAQPFSLEVRFTVQRGPRRRYRFQPRATGPGWWRIEDEWTGCQWRPVGREVLDEVEIRVTPRAADSDA